MRAFVRRQLREAELAPWSRCWGAVLRTGERRCEQKTCQHRHNGSRDIEHSEEICFPETPVVVGLGDDEARTEDQDEGEQIALPATAQRDVVSWRRPSESWLDHARLPLAEAP